MLRAREAVGVHQMNQVGVVGHGVGHAADRAVLVFFGDADRSPVAADVGRLGVVPDGFGVDGIVDEEVEVILGRGVSGARRRGQKETIASPSTPRRQECQEEKKCFATDGEQMNTDGRIRFVFICENLCPICQLIIPPSSAWRTWRLGVLFGRIDE